MFIAHFYFRVENYYGIPIILYFRQFFYISTHGLFANKYSLIIGRLNGLFPHVQ